MKPLVTRLQEKAIELRPVNPELAALLEEAVEMLLLEPGQRDRSSATKIPETYTCAECGVEYKFDWTDEEALAELKKEFDVPATDCVVVCDDCYRKVLGK